MCGNFLVFGSALCLNLGMAKLISTRVKVTIEHDGTTTVYTAPAASISGSTGPLNTKYLDIQLFKYEHAGMTTKLKDEGRTRGPVTDRTPSPEETAMIRAARLAERDALDAAAGLRDAQREAQEIIDNANHSLNKAILAYLQTGKGNVEASKVLEESGIYATEDRTQAVACANMDILYGVDGLNLEG